MKFNVDRKMIRRMRDVRRTLHQYPELAYREQLTADVVAKELKRLEIPYHEGVAGTGIIAELSGGSPPGGNKPCIALRADMDAIPLDEETGLSFASEHAGVMHACGHDGHMAIWPCCSVRRHS